MNTTNNLTPETCVEDIRRAYDLYLRSGHERYELNDVSLDSMGYLLPRRLEAKLVNAMNTLSVLRPLCTEVTTAGDRALPIVNDHGKAAWVPEGHTIPMVKDAFDRVNLDSHKLAAIIRVTSELLKDSAIDIEAYLADIFADRMLLRRGGSLHCGRRRGQAAGTDPSGEGWLYDGKRGQCVHRRRAEPDLLRARAASPQRHAADERQYAAEPVQPVRRTEYESVAGQGRYLLRLSHRPLRFHARRCIRQHA